MDPGAASEALSAERAAASELIETMSVRLRSVVEAGAGESSDDEHDPEGSTLAFERGQLVAQIERSKALVLDIDAALVRVDRGTYGICERCGNDIADARLEALPAARLCITCASSADSSRRWGIR
ncbi:TraR/DksA family transcriptional regulator [Williamsia limnetica]|uniref:TraR/DksA family transcriptional regulator n=1 Tax=Williamsia limnetica TaxID=882452 RepID=A0A318RIZ1_WILLI|nr:TraR/DksA C4-type zinc finger protein [Williamsia limnetica]PYE17521.1 TraR/DksA family transcriptional regulator [Williamsia limnetica]